MIAAPVVTVYAVLNAVAVHFRVPEREILLHRRDQHVAWPRHVTVGLASRLTTYSLPRIGRALGGRDHTTILHSRRRFDQRIACDPAAAREVDTIQDAILSTADGDGEKAELAFVMTEIEQRTAELAQLDSVIALAERRLASLHNSFEMLSAARAVGRARFDVIVNEFTAGQGAARRELDQSLDRLMRLTGGGHV
ncbi:helix-turn-helix domain-containing protein [Ancylobacter pratisalsi]|uniref:Chromosomal replication initiator DnaA C-terminal domain-containing protein n=1 Tax=Ancylobacter pratisalsi TaxID=1745854 RepID=A0A6P1YN76_9HYPH|nr:helix-turn-helix domain-containing protein [Ancylobacter pratisalsi]QIB34779.1 hypothetical protein G3A50_14475 [Ancylobacter pratisalsi]